MTIITEARSLQQILKKEHKNSTIGFVPTMGALHAGHKSLIECSKKENEITVVSIFVNPTQFLAGEDFDKYPKKFESDKKICELCKVDYLFYPQIDTLYSKNEVLIKAPTYKGFILEGKNRPGHFDGMLQIVLKLFNIVQPTNAYFGKKDAQQLILIKQMVKNFFLDINIVECDIIREESGLALSSRNSYLTSIEHTQALAISRSLEKAAKAIANGKRDSEEIKALIKDILLEAKISNIEYIQVVNKEFEPLETIELKNTILLIAVKIGTTRLIDNFWL
jgi:pantoate--beta-alanine ligase